MSKVELTFDEVSATSLGDVIRTGRVLSLTRTSHLTYQVKVESLASNEIAPLVRALTRAHKPGLIVAVAALDNTSNVR